MYFPSVSYQRKWGMESRGRNNGLCCEAGYMRFEKANEYDGSVNVRCDILMKWDFADVEGFLTDYTYGKNIDFSKYNKPGMYILDEEKK